MTRILVIVEPEAETQYGLLRIREIPPSADIDVHVVLYEQAGMASEGGKLVANLETRRQWLETLVAPLTEHGYCVTTEVKLFTRLHEAIVETVENVAADLVFKPLRQHGAMRRNFSLTTDAQLIRQVPVPILLISQLETVADRPVVAAIDLDRLDSTHLRLDSAVIRQAKMLELVLGSAVHYVHAYMPPATSQLDGGTLALSNRSNAISDLEPQAQALLREQAVTQEELHLVKGSPEAVISDYADAMSAGIIVLGTVARRGASGLIVGNTAELIHERTHTDLLVVK